MAGTNIDTVRTDYGTRGSSNFFKTVYATKNIERTFAVDRILHAKLERRQQSVVEGDHFKYPVHTGGSPAGAFIAEDTTIQAASYQRTAWQKYFMMTYCRPVQLSLQAIESGKNDKAAMKNLLQFELTRAVSDAKDDMAIADFTSAGGILTVCRSATSSTVFDVACPHRLRVGQKIVVAKTSNDATVTDGSATGGLSTKYSVVSGIDGNQVTIESASGVVVELGGTPASNWVIDAYGNSDYSVYDYYSYNGVSALNNRAWGFMDIFSTSDPAHFVDAEGSNGYFAGVQRTAGSEWNSPVEIDLAGGNILDKYGFQAATQVKTKSGGNIQWWVTGPALFEELINNSVSAKQARMQEKVANAWFDKTLFAGRPIYWDRYCDPDKIYGIDPSALWYAEQKPIGWEARDGSYLHRMETQLAYQALLTRMYQMCAIPSKLCVIKNVYSRVWS